MSREVCLHIRIFQYVLYVKKYIYFPVSSGLKILYTEVYNGCNIVYDIYEKIPHIYILFILEVKKNQQ